MNAEDLFNAIGKTDEKYLKKADCPPVTGHRNYVGIIASAAAALVVVAGVTAASFAIRDSFSPSTQTVDEENMTVSAVSQADEQADERGGAPAVNPVPPAETTNGNTDAGLVTATTVPSSHPELSGGETFIPGQEIYGGEEVQCGLFIPALPSDRTVVVTGEKITDEEALNYLNINKVSIISALSSSGVNTANARFSEKGYSYVSYTGKEGEKLEIRENYRDYILYSGDELVSIITLYKENGVIYNSPAFGGAWMKAYGDYLAAHKGQALVFVMQNVTPLIIAPDNSVYSPVLSFHGSDVSRFFADVDNPYSIFAHPSDTYTP